MLPASACRLLVLGVRAGSGDTTMQQIARRLSDDARDAVRSAVSRIEPALVVITSLLVGAILLSVMLPLMNIMKAIG
jgi:type IV pilus assembly protein PilC